MSAELLIPVSLEAPAPRSAGAGPVEAPALLAIDLDRLRTEEQEVIDRRRQEELARQQALARFD